MSFRSPKERKRLLFWHHTYIVFLDRFYSLGNRRYSLRNLKDLRPLIGPLPLRGILFVCLKRRTRHPCSPSEDEQPQNVTSFDFQLLPVLSIQWVGVQLGPSISYSESDIHSVYANG